MTCFGLNDTDFSRISLVKKISGVFAAYLFFTCNRLQLLFTSIHNLRNFGPMEGRGCFLKCLLKNYIFSLAAEASLMCFVLIHVFL